MLSTFLEIKIQLVNTPKYNEQYLVSNGCLWPFEWPMFSTWSNIFTFAPFWLIWFIICYVVPMHIGDILFTWCKALSIQWIVVNWIKNKW
jgi:hypothetical protein